MYWKATLTTTGMVFTCGNMEIQFETDWILFYGSQHEHFETLEEAFERAFELGANNPSSK